jgi:phosphatidate cytidylyltransferase
MGEPEGVALPIFGLQILAEKAARTGAAGRDRACGRPGSSLQTPPVTAELRNRLLFGAVLVLIIGTAVACDVSQGSRWGIFSLGLIAVLLGAREFTRLARVHAARVRLAPMIAVSLGLVAEAHLHPGGVLHASCPDAAARLLALPLVPLLLGAGLLWTTLAQMASRAPVERFFANVGGSLFGMVYLGLCFNQLERLAIEGSPEAPERGMQLLACFLVAVKCGDIAAFFGGKTFGRHKMCPAISPGKTWEGFACSFVGSVGGTVGLCALFAINGASPFAGWWQPVVWGLVLGPLGAAGDLAESCMKREASMKDSGRGAPGFGGYLDLLDAVILAAPVAYLLSLML